ncbi:hypothetical protein P26059A_0073 [Curvibacter phage P26059A]|nr:hypothetical protein P26059A_0073 [Curvibacter phage P26059A]
MNFSSIVSNTKVFILRYFSCKTLQNQTVTTFSAKYNGFVVKLQHKS